MKIRQQKILKAILTFFVLVLTYTSQAANVSWLSAINGNWSDGTKWSSGSVPTANDTAVIIVTGTYTVTFDASTSIQKLVLGGSSGTQTFAANNYTLTLNSASRTSIINTNGAMNIYGLTINGAGSLQNNGLVSMEYSNTFSVPFNNRATLNVNHYNNFLNGTVTTTAASIISVTGLSYTSELTFGNSFTNNGLLEMKSISSYTSNFYITTGSITNSASGNIVTNGPYAAAHTIFAPVINQGTITCNYNLTIQHSGASFNSSAISIGAGKQLQFSTGSFTFSSGTSTGSGTIYFNNCIVNYNLSTFQPISIIMDNATLNSTSNPLTNNTTNIQINASNIINANIANNDSIRITHYNNTMNGTMTNNVTGYFIVEGLNYTSDIVVNNTFNNFGKVELKSISSYNSSIGIGNGYSLTNKPGGLIKVFGPYAATFTINGNVDNQGTINTLYNLNITATAGTSYNSGAISIASGYKLNINGATYTYTGGTTTGPGSIYFYNCTANFNVSTFPGIDIMMDNTTLNSTSLPITNNSNLNLNASNIVNAAIFNNTGIIRVSHYNNSMLGALTTSTTSLISIDGSNYTSDIVWSSGFTNNGTIDLKSVSSYNSGFGITSGALINSASGVIHSYGPYASARTISGAVNNQGTITVDISLTISSANASSNSGNFYVAAGQQLQFTYGTYTFTGGIPTGTGKLYFNQVTTNFNNANYPNMFTMFDNTTINSNQPVLTLDTTWQINVSNTINANVFNKKRIRVTHYNNFWNGILTTNAASLLSVEGLNYTSDITFNTGFTNNGTIDLRSISSYNSAIYLGATATIINAVGATFHSYAGPYASGRTISGNWINHGNLIVDVSLAHTNTSSTSVNDGTITIAAGQSYTVTLGTYNFNGGTATGSGTFYFNQPTINYAVANFPSVLERFTNSIINSNVSPIANNNTLQIDASNTINANIKNNDTIKVSHYNNFVVGTMTSVASSVLSIDGGLYTSEITFNSNFTNNGLIELRSLTSYASTLSVGAGALITNAAGGTIKSWAGPYASGRYLNGAFANNGSIIIDVTLNHTNTGFTSSNTGSISIASGQQYSITGGTYNFNGGTATGKGQWYDNNVIANYNVSAFPIVWQMFDNTTINSNSTPIQNNNVLQWNASNIINASVKNNDSILVSHYLNVVHGAFISPAGSLLSINGQNYTSNITFDNAFTNHGTVELASISSYQSYLYFTNGTFINETDGTFRTAGPYNVNHILQAPSFENKGLFQTAYTLSMDMTAAPKAYYNRSTGTFKASGNIYHSNNTSFINEGHLTIGSSAGQADFTRSTSDSIHFSTTSNLDIEIGGYTVGSQYDKMTYDGPVRLSGTLNLSNINSFIPALGDSFIVMTYLSKTGTFSNITGQSAGGGKYWFVFYRPTYLVLRAGNPPNLSITASAGANGAISPTGVTSVFFTGTQAYTITPAANYHVLDVLVDGISVGAVSTYTFTNVTANHTISVTFVLNTWTITASSGANGTLAPAGVSSVNAATSKTYTITANNCYLIDSVFVDGASQGIITTYTFTNVVANHTIRAVFRNAPKITANGALTFCTGGSVTLDAGSGYSSYSWTGGGTSQTKVVTTGGTYTCTITSSGGCSNSTSVFVTVNPLPTVTLAQFYSADNNHACFSAAGITISSGNYGLPAGGTFSGLGVVNGSFSQSYVPSTAGVGSHVITYTYTDANGCSNSNTNTVIVDQSASVNAGTDIILCNTSLATLAGSIGGSATSATWSSSGNGSFSNSNSLTSTYTLSANDLSAGTVTLTLTSNNPSGPCGAVTDQLVITANPNTVVDAGSNTPICVSSVISLSGSITGFAANPHWTSSGSGSFANANALVTTYTASASDLVSGFVKLVLTPIDPLGNCSFAGDTLVAYFNPNMLVNAGSDVTLCGVNDTIATLVGTSVNAASVNWTSNGTGSFANANAASTTYKLSAADRANGNITLTLTTNDPAGPCIAVSDALNVKYKYATAVANGTYQVCGDVNTSLSSSATGNSYALSTLGYHWTTAGTGIFSAQNSAATTYTASVADLALGKIKVYVIPTDNAGACNYTKDSVEIYFDKHYSVNAGIDASVCSNDVLQLNGTSANTLSTTWQTSGNGIFGNANLLSTTYTPSALDSLNGYVWLTLISDDPAGPCTGVRDSTYITIHPAPGANAGNNTPICNGSDLNLTASGGTSYAWTGPNNFTSALQNIVIPNSYTYMSGTYTVVVTNIYGCSNSSSTVAQVNPCGCNAPALSETHSNVTCHGGNNGSINLTATGGSGGNTFLWSNGQFTEDILNLAADTFSVTVSVSGGCSATLSVIVTEPPADTATMSASGPLTFCEGGTVVFTASAGASYHWYPNNETTQSIAANASANYYVTIVSGAGCSASSATSVVTVNPGTLQAFTPTLSNPYVESFDSTSAPYVPCGMYIGNENNPVDAYYWYVSSVAPYSPANHMAIDNNPDNTTAKNDWFYSAPLNLNAAKTYQAKFWYRGSDAGKVEKFELYLGTATQAANMLAGTLLYANTAVASTTYLSDTSAQINPISTATYYLGFHASSLANKGSLYLDDIELSELDVTQIQRPNSTDLNFTLYPNPSDGLSIFINASGAGEKWNVLVYDVVGKQFFTEITNLKQGLNKIKFNEQLAAGIYFVKLSNGLNTKIEKLLVR